VFLALYGRDFKRSPASDIDVLGVRFDPDFAVTIAVGESKSGEDKALEELLKLRAIAHYIHATKMYFVKSKIHANAREIGRQFEVVSLDAVELLQMLKSLLANDAKPSDVELLSYRQQKEWLYAMRKAKQTQLLANYIESDAWVRAYWENVHNLIFFLTTLFGSGTKHSPPWTNFALFKVTSLLSISIMHLCRQIVLNSVSHVERGVEIFIFGGPGQRRQRERLRDEILKVIPTLNGLGIPIEPPFINDLKELVAYLLMSPSEAAYVPLVFQEAIDIVATKDGIFDTSKWSGMHSPITLKLSQDVLQFTAKSCGISKSTPALSAFLEL
jgi:hypothetical protein